MRLKAFWSGLSNHFKESWWEWMEMAEIFAYRKIAVVYFTDQNWISKTVYRISCVMVCKTNFTNHGHYLPY